MAIAETDVILSGEHASFTMTRELDLSILIVTWHSERWVERCLRSIPAACEGIEYEVIVHDNSDDNIGFAAGTNRAFARSRGRYALLLNPDCELAPRALTQLYEFLEARPRIAAAVPLLVDENGEPQREFQLRRLPTLGRLAAEVLLFDKVYPGNPATARYRYRDLDLTEPRRIEQPAAAALLLRRDVFEAVGPFDEQFAPAWFEDVDFCRRLAEGGREVWVVPSAVVRHFGGASLEHMTMRRFIEVWYGNMWRYARKWLRPGEAEALRWMIVGGMMMRCVAAAIGVRPREMPRGEAVRAYASVMRNAFKRWDSSPSSS
jgi:N-acetylglucosaminyl-diphospho-decaprenol L-rhamnosyltransferase